MSNTGWLFLFRKTLDSDFWAGTDEPFDWRSAFIHVLLSANWKQGVSRKNGHTITIERGQMLTSIRKLMATFHWSRKKVENWLDGMESYEMMTHKSVGFGTVLTVENFDKYQTFGASEGHTEGHTEGHAEEHNEGHAEGHTEGHSEDPRYKKKEEGRTKKEEGLSAHADPPPTKPEPPIGSPEWYALHYDD